MDNLPLRDIHLPEPLGWWPPAIGWWLLLALVLLLLGGLYLIHRRKHRITPARLALQALGTLENDAAIPPREKLQALSALMKRVALSSTAPRTDVASLTGAAWLQWLDETAGTTDFSQGPGRFLLDLPYRPAPTEAELADLSRLCREWLVRMDTTRPKTGAKRPEKQ